MTLTFSNFVATGSGDVFDSEEMSLAELRHNYALLMSHILLCLWPPASSSTSTF